MRCKRPDNANAGFYNWHQSISRGRAASLALRLRCPAAFQLPCFRRTSPTPASAPKDTIYSSSPIHPHHRSPPAPMAPMAANTPGGSGSGSSGSACWAAWPLTGAASSTTVRAAKHSEMCRDEPIGQECSKGPHRGCHASPLHSRHPYTSQGDSLTWLRSSLL